MKNLIIPLCLMLFSFKPIKQTKDCWQFLVNKKQVACGTIGDKTNVALSAKNKDVIRINYTYKGDEPGWKRTILIMDNDRKELWRKDFTTNSVKAAIDGAKLKSITAGKDFSVYTVSLPSDPGLAATMRIGTTLLCQVHWQ